MDDFIQDLARYGKKTHKSVMTAAHGIVNMVRELYPGTKLVILWFFLPVCFL
jgi:hypothetical protein